jgi:predicted RecA/RadA family phage recombinase
VADYLPLFKPGQDITLTTSAAVTGGQLLAISGSGTVAPTGAATVAWVGVAAFDAASGARVALHKGGVHRLTAAGAIAAGDQLVAAANGTVATVAAVAATVGSADVVSTRQIVGIALTSAAAGAAVDVDFVR